MDGSDRWLRASLYAIITALVIGVVALLMSVGPVVRPGYLRTASLAFILSCLVLGAFTVAWYWLLRLLGK